FEALFEEYVAGLERKGRAPGYLRDLKASFSNWVLPTLGPRPIQSIERRVLVDVVKAVTRGGRGLRGGGTMANRIAAQLTGFFRALVADGVLEHSRADRLPQQVDEIRRERWLADDEIAVLWRVANGLGYPWGTCIQTLLLTGARRCEVGEMRLSELD